MRGLYIHIPFCIRKCDYCDFYSLAGRLDCLDAYLKALLNEASQYGRLRFDTLFIGGGTPSLLGAAGLRNLMTGLSAQYSISKLPEATIEANPDSLSADLLRTALDCGINRISIGVQSLSDNELHQVGRIHTAAQAVLAIQLAQKEGFKNISADVILGLPGQNWQSLMTTLETLIGMNLPHISMYCLEVEPHTPLAANPPAGLASDDEQADLYAEAVDLLERRGFSHYEMGPAAASYYQGVRYKNKADLDGYLTDPCGQKAELEKLSKPQKAGEEAILRLRLLQEGLDLNRLIHKYEDKNVVDLAAGLNRLSIQGHLQRDGCIYRLNPREALVSNSILSELAGDQDVPG
jgi:oxygen-independent coproporphyrinogen-3 oxidase